jgi:hypothetical protein
MRIFFQLFLFICAFTALSQSKVPHVLIDAKMAKIPVASTTTSKDIAEYIAGNFTIADDKLRASFYWVTSNISYDVANMENIDFSTTPEQKVTQTLASRKGVCIHYAEVFNAIVKQLGFESQIIEGYTKQNGKVATLSHAWCAVKSEDKWWLIDPTWGAGSVHQRNFVKKRNNFYFKTPPKLMIATHMPYDYIWQLLDQPITNIAFLSGKSSSIFTQKPFDFYVEIENLKQKSEEIKLFESCKRVEANGVHTPLVQTFLLAKKTELAGLRNNSAIEKMNAIVAESNAATTLFNDFIFYRNKQFKPVLPDETIRAMITTPKEKVLQCQKKLETIGPVLDSNKPLLLSYRKNLTELLQQIEVQEQFVKEYLSKGKLARKAMFSKVTWFGLPLH